MGGEKSSPEHPLDFKWFLYVETIVHIDSNPYISWLVNKAVHDHPHKPMMGTEMFLFLCLQLHHPMYLRLTCLKMLSYSRQDEKAGRHSLGAG